ncbi:hypothetical protein QZH41_013394, partial [Actinostola sp. cb2023]
WSYSKILEDSRTTIHSFVCDRSPSGQPNAWLRSDAIKVNNARRIDVTIEYSATNCSAFANPRYCRHSFDLYAHQATYMYTPDKIPDPYSNPKVYDKVGMVNPQFVAYPKIDKIKNLETQPFEIKPGYSYVYLALHYTGGCFVVYGLSAHYYQCPSKAMSKSLIQLPQTMSPLKGPLQVKGSCARHAKPRTNEDDLYGYCEAEGRWSEDSYKGVCLCEAGYHEVNSSSGTECKACPSGTFKNTISNGSCIVCPLRSNQEIDRTRCKCESGYYRSEKETIFHNCTAPPSSPERLITTYHNATLVTMEWFPPSDLGGRSDVFYEVECKQCDDEGKDCSNDCDYAHAQTYLRALTNTSTLATVKHLTPYTYYKFKIFAKNGVSQVAEKIKKGAKFAAFVVRTSEALPGMPDITVAKPVTSTSVFLSWSLQERNGIITYYQVSYYPVGQASSKRVFNTTGTNATINGLQQGREYYFKVSFLYYMQRYIQARTSSMEKLGDGLLPLDGHKLYIDPSNYGNPMEALMSVTEEIDRKRIKLEKLIGGGEFAEVYKGTLISCDCKPETVAVKILKPKSSPKNREDFILEASIMGQFEHINVLGLNGVVTRSPETPMMIITEFMENGSLDHFLKNHDGHLTILQLLGIARGVAAGMDYLSAMSFIHRDLAARNILVADNMASKVADFGLSRELDDSEDNPDSEYQTQGGKIPVRWTAPEAIRYRKFSSASDVWSFGILLWEIMSFSERPYWDWDNFQVMDRVETGYRLPAPMNCPKAIHNLMLDCWDAEKNSRPKFPHIVTRIDEMIRSPEKMNDLNSFHSINNSYNTNFHEVNSVEEWLGSINMGRYTTQFANAGYMDLGHVKSLEEQDLSRIGVRLIGHRNKINKSIKAMNKHFESLDESDPEKQTFPLEAYPLHFVNATFVTIEWFQPSDLGGRSDVYYEVECKQCDDEGYHCTKDCTGAVITHTTRTTRMATVRHLSAYTCYQLKVFAKNGVTHLAEKNNEKSKYDDVVRRTSETASQSIPRQLLLGIIVGVVSFLVFVIVILVVCLYIRKARRCGHGKGNVNQAMDLFSLDGHRMYIDPSTYGSPMEALMSNSEEIDFHKMKLQKNIGGGEFAEVFKGILTSGSETSVVAVKILKEFAAFHVGMVIHAATFLPFTREPPTYDLACPVQEDQFKCLHTHNSLTQPTASYKSREDFILEASIMGQFNHPNVIELKGVVTRSPDTPMMIVAEFMENGSLEHFLKNHDGSLTVLQLLGIARGVAAGMAYLSGMNFIHRDLAARNILVADNMASKVADFGLSRELDDSEDNEDSEYQTQGGKIPVRWTAPEAIRYRKFSCASDVWSFGVLLWEIMSFAERPYWDWDNFQVMDRVEAGYRLPAPMNCPKSIHNIMLDCWEAEKNSRPKFPDIVQQLEDLIRSPEKINDDSRNSRYSNTNADMDFNTQTTVENWLQSISMARYANLFANAGFMDLSHVKTIEEEDLPKIGVRLIGHRNKINKSIKAMNKHLENHELESEKEAFLRDGQLTVLQLLGIARGVADGMAYLSGMNFIHRDLAARNILVADNMASKVADFGLSRELDNSEDNPDSEYQTQGGKIPVRWTAPEAIRYRKFSCASDVWSYGILLWEIMSFSERPYWDWDNFQVMERIEGQYRLPAPMNCPMSIHNIMLDCWEAEKNNRPKFPDIVKRLEDLIRSPEKINDDQNNYRFL